jgi:hypothetical protein
MTYESYCDGLPAFIVMKARAVPTVGFMRQKFDGKPAVSPLGRRAVVCRSVAALETFGWYWLSRPMNVVFVKLVAVYAPGLLMSFDPVRYPR